MGYNTSDDAGIYRISDELALVTTADFITPPVNDPYVFGQIAAANAISDVYAMGGEPKVCLNLLCFPSKILPHEDLEQIIAGANSFTAWLFAAPRSEIMPLAHFPPVAPLL